MTLIVSLGLAVGLIMALTGAGGGVLAVPLLVFATGLPVQTVSPIGLLAVGMAALLGALIGLKAGEVRYKAAALMGTVGLAMSPLGFWLAQRVDTTMLGLAFAVVLLWVAFNAFRSASNKPNGSIDSPPEGAQSKCPCIRSEVTGRFIWTWPCARALAFSGVLAGFLSGLLGVGGGFVLVPALQRFTNLTLQSITVTSLAVIAIVSAFGVFNSARAGVFPVEIGLAFAGAAIVGMLLGRALAGRVPYSFLKRAFGVMCLVVAALMVFKNLN